MEELLPFALGCILGFAVWRGTSGWLRSMLFVVAAFAAAFAATVLTGEYHTSWLYLLLDLSLAALGIIASILLVRFLLPLLRGAVARPERR
jgi:hypothetical protein